MRWLSKSLLPAGEISIDARFSYDINGLLEVDSINQELNINTNKVFKQNALTLTEDDIKHSRTRLRALKIPS